MASEPALAWRAARSAIHCERSMGISLPYYLPKLWHAAARGQTPGPCRGATLREGARRGGWLGRREGADRSVAGCHVRIRARPRTTPEVVSKMGYRPFPTV